MSHSGVSFRCNCTTIFLRKTKMQVHCNCSFYIKIDTCSSCWGSSLGRLSFCSQLQLSCDISPEIQHRLGPSREGWAKEYSKLVAWIEGGLILVRGLRGRAGRLHIDGALDDRVLSHWRWLCHLLLLLPLLLLLLGGRLSLSPDPLPFRHLLIRHNWQQLEQLGMGVGRRSIEERH